METSRRGPSLLLGAAHLAVLWAFAFAQPLLNLLAKNPEFFVARHNTSGDIILFACALMIVPPALMLGAEALANLVSPSARWFLHLALVGLLVAAIVLQVEKSIVSHPAKLMVLVALAAGAGAAYAYDRTEFAPLALTVLTPVPAILLLYFLLLSDVSELVLPQSKPELAEAAHVGSTAPVVALFLDEFPASTIEGPDGQIDARRFPHFAELARASTWYRNATTVADQTVQAVPALMTGQTPRGGELPNAHDHPKSIFTLLGGSYDMDVTESVTSVCPRSLCRTSAAASESFGARFGDLVSDLSLVSEHLLLPDSLADRLPPVNQTFGGFRNVGGGSGANNAAGEAIGPSDRAALFNRFLAGIDGDDKILHFLHLELPHRPWQYLPSGQSYPLSATGTGELQTPDGKRIPNKYAPELSWQRHLLQAEYADRLIGQLIGRMKREGIWKKAALVVTPDHGMAFVPNEPPRVATKGNFDQVAGVPTFIKAPGQTVGEPSDRRICTTDVLPILAGLLDTPVPWKSPPCPAEPANGGEVVIHSTRSSQSSASRSPVLRRARSARSPSRRSFSARETPAPSTTSGSSRGLSVRRLRHSPRAATEMRSAPRTPVSTPRWIPRRAPCPRCSTARSPPGSPTAHRWRSRSTERSSPSAAPSCRARNRRGCWR
jgi:hypothetical protein